ncbi:MAG: hypothetical protein A2X86_00770 [Bdellovibrionales bacterium GWA2_49_15]|nr:MAG: hypothetical protein A2X86_00770 [Bdellovibrionales bacterium GWA2_49_15]HAZ14606.1 hypothetical protein [Bdellovibrionales bacterium]
MNPSSQEDSLKLLMLSQTVGVLSHEISNVVAILGLRVGQLELLSKNGGLDDAERVSKLLASFKNDLCRFDSIISGMSRLSGVTDRKQVQKASIKGIIDKALELAPLELKTGELSTTQMFHGDAWHLTALFTFLFRYLRGQSTTLAFEAFEKQLVFTLSSENFILSPEESNKVLKPFLTVPSEELWGVEASVAYRIAQKCGWTLNINDEYGYLRFIVILPID